MNNRHHSWSPITKGITLFLPILFVALLNQGCGVYMAFTQPEKVDIAALEAEGLPRDHIIAKLGPPRSSMTHQDGTRTETYEFYEGSGEGWKVGRGIFHLGADIVSLGLWEVIATPAEFGIRGDKITAKAEYDDKDNLVAFAVLSRKEKPLEEVHEEYEF